MKKFPSVLVFCVMAAAVYWVFYNSMPPYTKDLDLSADRFSVDRALKHVKEMSIEPHALGFPAHDSVRAYIVSELEKMGLKVQVQEGHTMGDKGNMSKASNILARIDGTHDGKALLLLSHYDSNPHSSLGASDAASGVATILEGVRAFLSEGKKPKNDIIVLISDAEELGLNGAELFVDQHPWAKDVGLVLNFEARGSGGPSYTFIETNRGNQNLVREFIEAHPEYPMANSLYYSIYKLLPNDTDLTVFKQGLDVEGFNFAFIDDHFDYHTAQDSFERLDRNSLAHQGSYLMPLLRHFSTADLGQLKSLNDYVYFNIPFFGMVAYPFDWIWPMFALAVLVFFVLLVRGLRTRSLVFRDMLAGFVPMLLALVANGLAGYFTWPLLKWLYPAYNDILHGFTYNGHTYIAAMVLFSLAVCFYIYRRFKSRGTANLLFAPLLLWLAICGAVAAYLPGASFFIVPVFALLAMWFVSINQKRPDPLLLVLFSLPALWLFAPFIKGFAVGLGLKMMAASTLMLTLTFLLALPVFGVFAYKKTWAKVSLALGIGCMLYAHLNSGFNEENKRPNSLVYVLDTDNNTAQWATYDRVLTNWNKPFFEDVEPSPLLAPKTISSKYGSQFSRVAPAPFEAIAPPTIEKTKDTLIGRERFLELCITPNRPINRLDIYTNEIAILKASVNGIPLSEHYLKERKEGRLLTQYISDETYTEIKLTLPGGTPLELTLYEASNDLLEHPLFDIPKRPEQTMPMPFVVNDAILTVQRMRYD
ncbi:M20/M25/M40 family metallo-hydrolase [Pseudozobellia thermophila]|uniref:Vacuolar membrane protease n=1 Tax=Pseudozobellia thermophila TaxID=192903 RepID=A0A1M6CIE2_9FLAO|nr:M20/M25/M40 family metallo-hydrolase [Pseudozobellia thermophila]SHI60800.1 Peptidase family M28 [Pseudozobellia thermophila]